MCVSVCAVCTSHILCLYDMRTFVDDSDPMVMYIRTYVRIVHVCQCTYACKYIPLRM